VNSKDLPGRWLINVLRDHLRVITKDFIDDKGQQNKIDIRILVGFPGFEKSTRAEKNLQHRSKIPAGVRTYCQSTSILLEV
jgi:hypothetical protein